MAILDGLLQGSGDAVIGINPATDSIPNAIALMEMLDEIRLNYDMPVQSCILTHITNAIETPSKCFSPHGMFLAHG